MEPPSGEGLSAVSLDDELVEPALSFAKSTDRCCAGCCEYERRVPKPWDNGEDGERRLRERNSVLSSVLRPRAGDRPGTGSQVKLRPPCLGYLSEPLPRQKQDLEQGAERVAELLRGLPNEHELIVFELAVAAEGAWLDRVLDALRWVVRPKLRFDRVREELRAPRAESARRNGPAPIDNGFDALDDVCRRNALDRSPAPIGKGVL